MILQKIAFKNYKAFKERQELQIKPITILIGKNSSGKSVVSRLPILLGRSVNGSASPIELQFDGFEYGGSFKDLVHNRIDHGRLSFGLSLEGKEGLVTLEVTVQNIADSPIQIISDYSINSKEFNLKLAWDLDYGMRNPLSYKISGSIDHRCLVKFKGILIEDLQIEGLEDLKSRINNVNSLIRKALSVDYLGPFRELPKRDYIYKGSIPEVIGLAGENAPQILALNQYSDKNIIEGVSNWYRKNLGGWKLEIQNVRDKFEVVLASPDDPKVKVNLADVGHGMSQVLPLIVRSFIRNNSNLMIVEQPELHLHPAAHAPLAELFTDIIFAEKSNWIIETHSEVFILRIRRLIAENKISPDSVVIYHIDDEARPGSALREIKVDASGEVDYWPDGVFSEDYKEVVGLRMAQK